jgi:ubiquinone/menaquinone biosynthesis C-methylase UbiE
LSEMYRVTKPGGWLVVTVPAYGFLWSEHDEALHHRRRYTASELRNKITNAGFTVERSTYFITTLFFPILLFRIINNLTKKSLHAKTSHIILPKWANSLLVRILDLERLYIRHSNLPFGVSLICTAQKPGGYAAGNGAS